MGNAENIPNFRRPLKLSRKLRQEMKRVSTVYGAACAESVLNFLAAQPPPLGLGQIQEGIEEYLRVEAREIEQSNRQMLMVEITSEPISATGMP